MKTTLRNTVIAGWMAFGAMGPARQIAAAASPDAGRKISICVFNYAHVELKTLAAAGAIVSRIFAKVGVETDVVEVAEGVELSPCESPALFVVIYTREMAEVLHLPANVLGLAPGTAEEYDPAHERNVVYVFHHIADQLIRKQDIADKAAILGHAMAHEIGHILLHMNQHSHAGIMQANWDRKYMEAMTMGGLTFDSNESARIRAEVRRRTNQQPTVKMAALQ
jgi:hypothetical protein